MPRCHLCLPRLAVWRVLVQRPIWRMAVLVAWGQWALQTKLVLSVNCCAFHTVSSCTGVKPYRPDGEHVTLPKSAAGKNMDAGVQPVGSRCAVWPGPPELVAGCLACAPPSCVLRSAVQDRWALDLTMQ
jgi:hypothetical protein